jgi:hypothetical protein
MEKASVDRTCRNQIFFSESGTISGLAIEPI